VLGSFVLVLGFSCGAFAEFIADGNLADWGVTPGSDWTNDVGAAEWLEPEVGNRGYLGPGYGGKEFNVEAAYTVADCDYIYYAIVTGLPSCGAWGPDDRWHYPGDVFIDLDPTYVPSGSNTPTGRMEYAVETTTYSLLKPRGGKASKNQGAGSFYSNVGLSLASEKWDDVYYPDEIKRSGHDKLADATLEGETDFAYTDDFYGSDHWVIEGLIPRSMLPDIGDTYTVYWTMTCANDIGTVVGEVPVCETPEPGSLMLVGSGCVFGLGLWFRRRMK